MYVDYTIHNVVEGKKMIKFTSGKVSLAEISTAVAREFSEVDPATLEIYTCYDEDRSLCVSQ